jgi:signal transduction histidine kinase/CheY-like chemotaxis protein
MAFLSDSFLFMKLSPTRGAWRQAAARQPMRYALAVALFAIALVARFSLVNILPARGFPFLSFFPAVLITTWLVGLGPGLLVAALSTCAAWAFFMGPPVALWHMERSDLIALVFFAGILVVDCIVIELMNSAMSQLRATSEKLRRSEQDLLAREAELREADRQKDVFLAMLAHELRNPLAPIRSAAQLIAAIDPKDEKVKRAAAIIARQSGQLTRLVDDLLDVSRIQSSKLTLQLADIDLRQVIDGALETCQPLIDAAGHHFSASLPASPVPVRVDAVRIAQCVSNLLNNAIKFTPDGGRIALTVMLRDDDTVAIAVSDSGRGIAPAMLPKLFGMFAQEHASGMNGNSGLGIGLALTRHLVTQHGGSIEAHSDGPGAGARFEIVLPLAQDGLVAAPERDVVLGAGSASTTATVLVVDDNVDSAQMMQALLEMEGYNVVIAYDGAGALRAIAHACPSVVLLDVGLPDMSGYQVAQRARAEGMLNQDTLLVALTGWSDQGSRAASAAAGIAYHLNKPVQLAQLLELMRAHLDAPAAPLADTLV